MATVSFDRKIILQEKDIPSFLNAIDTPNTMPSDYYNAISPSEMERNEQLLKQYFCS